MAKNATVIEDSDVEMDEVPKNNKKAANGGSDEVEGGSTVEEEEYEIEGILGHRYAMKEFGVRVPSQVPSRSLQKSRTGAHN